MFDHVGTSSDIVFITSIGLQLPYHKKNKKRRCLQKTSEWGAGPERDMISLRDGMGSGWDGKFFRRRRRRRRRRRPWRGGGSKWKSQNRVGFLENRVKSKGKAHESAKNEKNGIWDGDLSIARLRPSWKVSMKAASPASKRIYDVRKTSVLVEKN